MIFASTARDFTSETKSQLSQRNQADQTKQPMKTKTILAAAFACALVLFPAQAADSPYKFDRGFPATGTAEKAYEAADLRRAIEAYKFFYLTIASEAVMQQGQAAGVKVNESGTVMATGP